MSLRGWDATNQSSYCRRWETDLKYIQQCTDFESEGRYHTSVEYSLSRKELAKWQNAHSTIKLLNERVNLGESAHYGEK